MARPGIMLYFDILEPIKVLPDADKGRLLVAMLEYGQTGAVPQFEGMLALAWGFVKPKIDKDKESYDRQIQQKQYAAFSREIKKKGLSPVSYDDWKNLSDIERERMISDDIGWYPTTTTIPATSSSTNTSTNTSTAAAANTNTTEDCGGDGINTSNVTVLGGELGKGVVFLSDDQVADLLDKLDIDTFDYYVEKLANFIIKNDAHVKNHYETILKWWREDGAVLGSMG
jgi:hypothetical protein